MDKIFTYDSNSLFSPSTSFLDDDELSFSSTLLVHPHKQSTVKDIDLNDAVANASPSLHAPNSADDFMSCMMASSSLLNDDDIRPNNDALNMESRFFQSIPLADDDLGSTSSAITSNREVENRSPLNRNLQTILPSHTSSSPTFPPIGDLNERATSAGMPKYLQSDLSGMTPLGFPIESASATPIENDSNDTIYITTSSTVAMKKIMPSSSPSASSSALSSSYRSSNDKKRKVSITTDTRPPFFPKRQLRTRTATNNVYSPSSATTCLAQTKTMTPRSAPAQHNTKNSAETKLADTRPIQVMTKEEQAEDEAAEDGPQEQEDVEGNENDDSDMSSPQTDVSADEDDWYNNSESDDLFDETRSHGSRKRRPAAVKATKHESHGNAMIVDELEAESDSSSLQPRRIRRKAVGTSCHQCKICKTAPELVQCTKMFERKSDKGKRRCQKKFCSQCLMRFYPNDGIVMKKVKSSGNSGGIVIVVQPDRWDCPCCLNNCKCSACRRSRREGVSTSATAITPTAIVATKRRAQYKTTKVSQKKKTIKEEYEDYEEGEEEEDEEEEEHGEELRRDERAEDTEEAKTKNDTNENYCKKAEGGKLKHDKDGAHVNVEQLNDENGVENDVQEEKYTILSDVSSIKPEQNMQQTTSSEASVNRMKQMDSLPPAMKHMIEALGTMDAKDVALVSGNPQLFASTLMLLKDFSGSPNSTKTETKSNAKDQCKHNPGA